MKKEKKRKERVYIITPWYSKIKKKKIDGQKRRERKRKWKGIFNKYLWEKASENGEEEEADANFVFQKRGKEKIELPLNV